jgi:16S rRNA (guanine966-N2)-methyltransferase
MRIVAGTLGGRTIKAPRGTNTRPTSDRVREGVFSRLESLGAVENATVLDVFAGSGALGLEALSRGARSVTFVERDREALRALNANIQSLAVQDAVTVVSGDVGSVLGRAPLPGSPFGLLILDPPYRIENAEVREVIDSLRERNALASGCLLVWEHDTMTQPDPGPGWSARGPRRYGGTTVSVYGEDVES